MAGVGSIVGETVSSKVELSISCSNLKDMDVFSKSDPVVFLYEHKGRERIKLGRTEVIDDNLNPKFATTIIVDYRFEELQQLSFVVYDVDDRSRINDASRQEVIGELSCSLADIVTAGERYTKSLRYKGSTRGTISIAAEELQDSKFDITMQLSAVKLDKKDFFGKSDPFVEVSKALEGGGFTIVYRSSPVMKNLNPRWNRFTLKIQQLCGGDWDRTLQFSVWDWNSSGTHDFIGSCSTSLSEICPERGGNVSELPLINHELQRKKRKYNNSGTLVFNSVIATPTHSFMDYVKGGCQIGLITAIDFTASNGAPQSPSSLHYINPYHDNEYVAAIKSVASVLAPYDSDQLVPVFGFGAKCPPSGQVSHCFPLTFNQERPEVYGVQGILDVYKYAIGQVQLYGPTNFSSFLEKAIQYASTGVTQESQNYYILLVITDGVISDMSRTVDKIVAASNLPLSIVIVGVGSADFANMEVLDADDNPLVDKYGKKMSRDIVQFVPLREFQTRTGANFSLARETLAEIPDQFLAYMKSHGIRPNPPPRRNQFDPSDSRNPAGPPYPSAPSQAAPYSYPTGRGSEQAPPYPM